MTETALKIRAASGDNLLHRAEGGVHHGLVFEHHAVHIVILGQLDIRDHHARLMAGQRDDLSDLVKILPGAGINLPDDVLLADRFL